MSYWPGGDFHALSGISSQYTHWGYYDFDHAGRLIPRRHESNSILLAARINPVSGLSHNDMCAPRRLAVTNRELRDNWRASLLNIDALLDDVAHSNQRIRRSARDELIRLLDNLGHAIDDNELVD